MQFLWVKMKITGFNQFNVLSPTSNNSHQLHFSVQLETYHKLSIYKGKILITLIDTQKKMDLFKLSPSILITLVEAQKKWTFSNCLLKAYEAQIFQHLAKNINLIAWWKFVYFHFEPRHWHYRSIFFSPFDRNLSVVISSWSNSNELENNAERKKTNAKHPKAKIDGHKAITLNIQIMYFLPLLVRCSSLRTPFWKDLALASVVCAWCLANGESNTEWIVANSTDFMLCKCSLSRSVPFWNHPLL